MFFSNIKTFLIPCCNQAPRICVISIDFAKIIFLIPTHSFQSAFYFFFLCFVSNSPMNVILCFSINFLMGKIFPPFPIPLTFQHRQFICNRSHYTPSGSHRYSCFPSIISSLLDFLRPLSTAPSSVVVMPSDLVIFHVFCASIWLEDGTGEESLLHRTFFFFSVYPLCFLVCHSTKMCPHPFA